jgi:hypothetical protein
MINLLRICYLLYVRKCPLGLLVTVAWMKRWGLHVTGNDECSKNGNGSAVKMASIIQ